MLFVCCPQARQLSELLDFAEQERLTLLEKEAALQQELEQVRLRCRAARLTGWYDMQGVACSWMA